jgi:hypothetical protein
MLSELDTKIRLEGRIFATVGSSDRSFTCMDGRGSKQRSNCTVFSSPMPPKEKVPLLPPPGYRKCSSGGCKKLVVLSSGKGTCPACLESAKERAAKRRAAAKNGNMKNVPISLNQHLETLAAANFAPEMRPPLQSPSNAKDREPEPSITPAKEEPHRKKQRVSKSGIMGSEYAHLSFSKDYPFSCSCQQSR